MYRKEFGQVIFEKKRLRHTWEYNIEMDLKEIQGESKRWTQFLRLYIRHRTGDKYDVKYV
jgi:hypothetical protein